MKKRIALLLALVLSLGAFALTACTDKDTPRELDAVELKIVGTWNTRLNDNSTMTFNDDGTWTRTNGSHGTFTHRGDGVDAELGHYERIYDGFSNFGLFDIYPDRLYYINFENEVQGYYERQ